jgi:hypothetical protein
MTFSDIYKKMELEQDTHVLTIDDKEIGFVYYRTGYQEEQYLSNDDWEARQVMELS